MRHVTSMRRDHPSTAAVEPFIGEMARRALADRDPSQVPTFRVLYPNLGLLSDDGGRAVVVTHGHYLEPMYRAMTQLHNVVIPRRPPRLDVGQIEADNWAWIDFFWSTMGRSGEGENSAIPILYELLQSEDAIEAVVDRVVDDLVPRKRSVVRRAERLVLRRAGQGLCTTLARRERHQPALLSPEAAEGLTNYLAGPVRTQLMADFELEDLPRRVDLVFGHTHKPFAGRRYTSDYPGPVVAHNSGGWVVDSTVSEPMKGASVVLIGADLEVVDLAVYRQEPDLADYRVQVCPVNDPPDEPTPLRHEVQASLARNADQWADVATGAAETVVARQVQLEDRIRMGTLAVRTEPPVGPRGW